MCSILEGNTSPDGIRIDRRSVLPLFRSGELEFEVVRDAKDRSWLSCRASVAATNGPRFLVQQAPHKIRLPADFSRIDLSVASRLAVSWGFEPDKDICLEVSASQGQNSRMQLSPFTGQPP